MTKIPEFEEFLLNRINYNKSHNPIKNEGEKREYKELYETAFTHLINHVIPLSKKNGEVFIDYWPGKFLTGEKKEYKRAYYQDKHYLYVSGIFGTGYIAMTINNLYIVSLEKLTSKYPLYKLGIEGFGWDVLSRMQGEVNHRRPLLQDKINKILTQSIIGAQIIIDEDGIDAVDIRTTNQHFLFYPHFINHDNDIVNCVQYVNSGKLDQLINNNNQDDLGQVDVMEKLRRLKKLLDEDIISKEEYDEKKKEYLSKL